MELEGMTPSFAVRLGEEGVKSLDDVAGLVPDDITGWREPGPDGKPVWVEGILKKGEMRKDDAQMFIMKARVAAGWIEADAIDQMLAAQKEAETPQELTEEERALLALNTLDGGDASELDFGDLEDIDLDALVAEGGDDSAASED
ncbi:MAG: hypothetical protein R3C13_05170 [Hyphomonas sp.]|uniref:hypothetical protein n=1 Tax=Hyphomonas sp. TaxID=87 RepID=UPI0035291000